MSPRPLPEVPAAFAGRPRPLVMAHRGSSALAPENTRASFERAVRDGADIVETDLHLTRDGVFVCLHDPTLLRTGGVPVTVADVTLAELKRHPVPCGRAEFGSERVPTLDELIALLSPGTGLALELKTDRFLEPGVARRLGETLRTTGLLDRTAVLSFEFERCRAVKREVPELFAGFITRIGILPPKGEAQMVGPFWPVLFANPFFVFRARRRGLLVAPLDERPDGRLWYYRLLGCDAVLTNDPGATLRKLGRSRR